jgi:hypothetical protein
MSEPYWNYRVIKWDVEGTEHGDYYSIHEVYYDEKAKPTAYAKAELQPFSETVEGLEWILREMGKAISQRPILVAAEHGWAYDGDVGALLSRPPQSVYQFP